jgi:hypothetical protein
MDWVVDSCVLLDIALGDLQFGISSAYCLDSNRSHGLVVCPISQIEIAPEFNGDSAEVSLFLQQSGCRPDQPWELEDTLEACAGWNRYVRLKRIKKHEGKRTVADILIGAYAIRRKGLITRNPHHFRPFFPKLLLIVP